MNERIGNNKIYLLAKEAGLIEFEQLDWNPELVSPTYESVAKARKFAELIVQECIRCCDDVDAIQKHYLKYGIDQELDAKQCIEVIKKHFGVEL